MAAQIVQKLHYETPHRAPTLREVRRLDGTIPSLLFDLLVLATPYGTEKHIINLFPFKNEGTIDEMGNFYIKIGENPTTMFSSHMDTVHHIDKKSQDAGINGLIRLITFANAHPNASQKGFIWGAVKGAYPIKNSKQGEIRYDMIELGADDKVGVYIMCKLIEAKVPGFYIFHVGEECGGKGSHAFAKAHPDLLVGLTKAIAFDRKGYTDVIAHQSPGRTASIEFTNEIAKRLNTAMGAKAANYTFKGDGHGTFTDTASYSHLIAECTNIACGYFDQHTGSERFDAEWFKHYFPAIMAMEWETLPISRDPKKVETPRYTGNYGHTYRTTNQQWDFADRDPNNSHIHINGNKVGFAEIKFNTFRSLLPQWTLADGYKLECSTDGMLLLIDKWLEMNIASRTKQIAALLLRLYEAEEEVKELTKENQDLMQEIEVRDNEAELSKIPQEVFVANLATKRRLIKSLNGQLSIRDMSSEPWNVIVALMRRFRKLEKKLRRAKAICTYDDYVSFNTILVDMLGSLREIEIQTPAMRVVVKEAVKFIRDNIDEEGFNVLKSEITEEKTAEQDVAIDVGQ